MGTALGPIQTFQGKAAARAAQGVRVDAEIAEPVLAVRAELVFTVAERLDDTNFATIEPEILYFGTPVVLISTLNEDGTPNLAPPSCCWALGWTAIVGLVMATKTLENLERERECVLSIPGPELWESVERLAPLTGKNPVPESKAHQFHFEKDKFGTARLTPLKSELVAPPRVLECPLHFEAQLKRIQEMSDQRLSAQRGAAYAELGVIRVHARRDVVLGERHIDPAHWQPLIYNFRHYFGLGEELGKNVPGGILSNPEKQMGRSTLSG